MVSPKQFDEELYESWHIEFYNAEELAEGLVDPDTLIKRSETFDEEPDLHKIAAKVKELGYDTFEVVKETEHRKRYIVEG